ECVCQGLQDIFEFIGGVPPLLIFDNATGVGRRIGDAIHESELFSRFRAHYHFRVRFCNPYSGWEKGNVERKVDYNRANLFVPVPHFNERSEERRVGKECRCRWWWYLKKKKKCVNRCSCEVKEVV